MSSFRDQCLSPLLFSLETTDHRVDDLLVRKECSHLPPAPFHLPIIGHLHLLGPVPHQVLHKLYNRHAPLFQLFLGSTPCVVASSPEIAKEIFKTHDIAFSDRPPNIIVDYFTYGGKGLIFGRYGASWKFLKKIIVSQRFNGKTLDYLYSIRRDEITIL
ncbi:putative 3,9-dihydroxypterocarpan 6A-monooxygenase [Helianthus anomalus]